MTEKESRTATLVLLDRDGVLSEKGNLSIYSYSQFKLVPGLHGALKKLSGGNFRIGVVTNQPDLSRGLLSREDLSKMHSDLDAAVKGADIAHDRFIIEVCPHTKEQDCACRKPRVRMVDKVMAHFKLDPARTRFYMIGDMLTDLQLMENYYNERLKPLGVRRKAVTTILLDWKHSEASKERVMVTVGDVKVIPDLETKSLEEAIDLILKSEAARS